MKMLTVSGVAWVLIRDGHVLLERCPKKAREQENMGQWGEWFVPGGKIECGESEAECLVRELREEWPGVTVEEFIPLPLVQIPGGPEVRLMQPYLIEIRGHAPTQAANGVPLLWFPCQPVMLNSPVAQVRMMVAAAAYQRDPNARWR